MSTAAHVFHSNLQLLVTSLPAVRDGDVEAIHDARVATRRLRAVLRTAMRGPRADHVEPLARLVKRAGRALGRVRDLDVSLSLLRDLEERAPATAAAVATLRAELLPKRLRRVRRLLKRLERLQLRRLSGFASEGSRWTGRGHRLASRRLSLPSLPAAIAEQAEAAQSALERASGIYFPKRAHALRIALKKLRYSLELLDERDAQTKAALRALRAAQQSLGDLHDREVLAQRLKRERRRVDVPHADELGVVLEAESRSLFAKYLERRASVIEAVAAVLASVATPVRRFTPARIFTMGAVALPSAAAVLLAARALKT